MWYYLPSITLCFTFSGRDALLNCASCSDEGLCCSLLSDWVGQTLSSSDRDTSASSSPDNPTHGPSQTAPKNKNGRPDEWLHLRPWNSVAHWLQHWPWLLYHLSERSSSLIRNIPAFSPLEATYAGWLECLHISTEMAVILWIFHRHCLQQNYRTLKSCSWWTSTKVLSVQNIDSFNNISNSLFQKVSKWL